MYRKLHSSGSGAEWATREIAALDFLLGIPLEVERDIVRKGFQTVDETQTPVVEATDKVSFIPHFEAPSSPSSSSSAKDVVRSKNPEWWGTIVDSDIVNQRMKKIQEQQKLTDLLEAPEQASPRGMVESQTYLPTIVALASRNSTSIPVVDVKGASLVPGRRLDGNKAHLVQIPLEAAGTEVNTRYRTVARRAAVREWEKEMINSTSASSGVTTNSTSILHNRYQKHESILDGRLFLSSMSSYPMATFSIIKYDPKNEEELRQRQKIEALGGGGSKFLLPKRDWRGVSYRELLPRKERKNKTFNRMQKLRIEKARNRYEEWKQLQHNDEEGKGEENEFSHYVHSTLNKTYDNHFDDEANLSNISDPPLSEADSDISTSSSDESTVYEPGFLDDPDMKQGKHRHVLVGDRVIGPVMISSVHFVSPVDLKNDLNRQFRQRFEDWEPPRSQRKYIGARVIDGRYTLIDPTNLEDEGDNINSEDNRRRRKSSLAEYDNIRMPPSLTLSKIRSLKKEALDVCVKANLEVSTVALACVYFERLCLDCRVDKSNRRLTFATCLLLALKVNESNVKIVHEENKESKKGKWNFAKSTIRPNIEHDFFENLFLFITHEWQLNLKELFQAEFGVFAALRFKLSASPSQISFHFKRLLRSLEWSPLEYLGKEMYDYWQAAQESHIERLNERESRKSKRKRKKEKELLRRQRKLHQKDNPIRQQSSSLEGPGDTDVCETNKRISNEVHNLEGISNLRTTTGRRLQFFHRLKKSSNTHMEKSSFVDSSAHETFETEKAESVTLSRSLSMPDVNGAENVEPILHLELGGRTSSVNTSSPDLHSKITS